MTEGLTEKLISVLCDGRHGVKRLRSWIEVRSRSCSVGMANHELYSATGIGRPYNQ